MKNPSSNKPKGFSLTTSLIYKQQFKSLILVFVQSKIWISIHAMLMGIKTL